MIHPPSNKPIVLFDGICNLCNASVSFIIKHDKKNHFLFSPLQSNKGKELLSKFSLTHLNETTLVLIENNKVYMKSSAALKITKRLNGFYPMLYVFVILPLFIRNFIYDFVAKNRYKWFGKKDNCMIPSQGLMEKFLFE